MNKLTIIIPHFNTPKELKRLLGILLPQVVKYPQTEIIVVDDGSRCDMEWIKKCPIKTVFKKNGGVSSARNVGLGLASGNFVAFIDSDDIIAGDYLKTIYGAIQDFDGDYLVFPFYFCNKGRKRKMGWRSEELKNYVVWGYVYKRECIGNERFDENINVGEDVEWLRRVLNGKEEKVLDKIIYYYQWDANINSLTKRFKRGMLRKYKKPI